MTTWSVCLTKKTKHNPLTLEMHLIVFVRLNQWDSSVKYSDAVGHLASLYLRFLGDDEWNLFSYSN